MENMDSEENPKDEQMSDAMFWGMVDMFCRLKDTREDLEMAALMGDPLPKGGSHSE